MGLPAEDVLDTGACAVAAEFTCAVCTSIVPYRGAVVTPCNHVFCRQCLSTWLQRDERCPNCLRPVRADSALDVRPLEEVNHLAWRILGRLRVRCPLGASSVRCQWRGDYSEYHAHVMTCDVSRRGGAGASERGEGCKAKKGRSSEEDSGVRRSNNEVRSTVERGTARENGSGAMEDESGGDGNTATASATPLPSHVGDVFKEQGNARFAEGQYLEAIQLYSRAVAADPRNVIYLNNRAAAWMHVGGLSGTEDAWVEAQGDLRKALGLDPTNAKALTRLGKSLMFTVGCTRASAHFKQALCMLHERSASALVKSSDVDAVREEAERVWAVESTVVDCRASLAASRIDAASAMLVDRRDLLRQYETPELQLLYARVAIRTGDIEDALRRTRTLIRNSKGNVDALVVRAGALYQCNGEVESASSISHLKEALRQDPDHASAKQLFRHVRRVQAAIARGKSASSSRDFEGAIDAYDEILRDADAQLRPQGGARYDDESATAAAASSSDFPLHHRSQLAVEVFEARAAARFRLKEYDACLNDCAKALYSTEASVSASLLQAKALMALDKHAEAARGLRSLLEVDPTNTQLRSQYDKVVFEQRRLARPDYYGILGLESKGRVASAMEIRGAYKARAMDLHPDRAAPEKRAEAEVLFKELQEALEILSDDMKRELYDNGYDKEAIQERVEAAHRAAHKTGDYHRHHHH